MKKSIFILLAVVLIASGCRKENSVAQSYLYETSSSSWATSDTGITWATGFVVPEIDQSIINGGAVLIYYVDGSNTNYPVPYFENSNSEDVNASIAAFDGNSNDPNVVVSIESTNGIAFLNPGVVDFRIVVIPSQDKSAFVAPAGWHRIQSAIKR